MRELQNAIGGSGASSEADRVEVWFHEDCIAWMSDVRLVGHVILGNNVYSEIPRHSLMILLIFGIQSLLLISFC